MTPPNISASLSAALAPLVRALVDDALADAVPSPAYVAHDYQRAAQLLGVSVRTVERLIKDGDLETVRVRGCVLIPHASLQRLIGADDAALPAGWPKRGTIRGRKRRRAA